MTVSFNLEKPVFQDVRLRRAFGHALDRDQFLVDQRRSGCGRGRLDAARGS